MAIRNLAVYLLMWPIKIICCIPLIAMNCCIACTCDREISKTCTICQMYCFGQIEDD